MSRMYIAGPISGIAEYRQHFTRAQLQLEAAGHVVLNPAEIGDRPGWGWSDYMRAALMLMLQCQQVALLPGWEASRGARLERTVALELGMDVRPLSEWMGVAECAPDPILEAAAEALKAAHMSGVVYIPRPQGPPATDWGHWGAEVLAAVRPLIEAEVREVVAREIEADPCAEHGEVGCPAVPCRRESVMASHYARIARGSNA